MLVYAQILVQVFRLIARREDFDQQDRIGQHRFFGLVRCASHRQVGHTHIVIGQQMRDDAGLYHQTAWAIFAIQVIVDQRRQPALQSTEGPAGRRMARGSPSTSSYLRASPESQFRNSLTDIRAEILANTTMGHLYQNFVISR